MICYFCQQEIPSEEIYRIKSFPNLYNGTCLHCQIDNVVAITIMEDEKLISAHLYVWRGKERYHFLFHFRKNYFSLRHVTAISGDKIIYSGQNFPKINANNVLEKLPLYLLFS
jgi:hypothetical protein